MKVFYMLVSAVLVLSVYTELSVAGIDLPWSTTFDCPEWEKAPSGGTKNYLDCDNLDGGTNWSCGDKRHRITTAANYPPGGGGRGQRRWECDGKNNNTGSVNIKFNNTEPEIWMRWYMRYEVGYKYTPNWVGNKILYIHTLPGNNNHESTIVQWYRNNKFRIYNQAGTSARSGLNYGWTTTQCGGGRASDGLWHCYEIHLRVDTDGTDGIIEAWIDGVAVISGTGIDFGWPDELTGYKWLALGHNQKYPDNGRAMYVDYDDVVINTTGYIGPIITDTTPPLPPVGLKIIQ